MNDQISPIFGTLSRSFKQEDRESNFFTTSVDLKNNE